MKTVAFQIELPEDILLSLNESGDVLKQRVKISLAIKLYKMEKLTIRKAIQLSGLSRLEFETLLSQNSIPISNFSLEDILADVANFN